jgi:hypothetical protein
MIYSLDCMTRLDAGDAMSRMRDAISRAGGRIAEHRLEDGAEAQFNFTLRDDRFETFRDHLPEIAIHVERGVMPERIRRREVRCYLTVTFEPDDQDG